MKQYVILFFALIFSHTSYCQNYFEEGDKCFNNGDYACAEIKYNELYKSANESDKQLAEIKIERAKLCSEYLKAADQAFQSNNFKKALENYQLVLDSNKKDAYAKSQIEICNTALKPNTNTTLTLSKTEIAFIASGGNESITINTNSNVYSIELLPSWCTVQRYGSYFIVSCTANSESIKRTDYFNVKAGNKTIRVNIIQQGSSSIKEYFLEVSKTNLYFLSEGSLDNMISVSTNAVDFSVTLIPSWCIVKKYKDYITVSCLNNESNVPRNDWFKIISENKEVKIYITQSGKTEKPSKEKYKKSLTSFSSIGFQSGEIAKYGLIYESGGAKFIGFHMSIRSSLTPEEDIESGLVRENKTEIDLGPNFKIAKRLFVNLGVGYGYYNYMKIDYYADTQKLEKMGYLVASSGLMFRISRLININGGVSFMDIDKDIYTPEITAGITFNLKKK